MLNKHENTADLIYRGATMKPRAEIQIINDCCCIGATEGAAASTVTWNNEFQNVPRTFSGALLLEGDSNEVFLQRV